MRADARANRTALVTAARRLYAARGQSVPFSAVAQEAGLGIATLYRHFPTQQDLVLGLAEQARDDVVAVCARHQPLDPVHPEPAWRAFVTDLVDLELGAFLPQVAAEGGLDLGADDLAAARGTALTAVNDVLTEAKRAGLVREDVDVLHFHIGLGSLTRPLPEPVLAELSDLRAWLVDVYCRGLG